jgi:surface antigen
MRSGPKFLAALLLTASLAGCYYDPNYGYGQRPYGGGSESNGAYGNNGGYGAGSTNNGGYAGPACQPVQTTIIANGQQQPVYGRACQQSDGSWRIVP